MPWQRVSLLHLRRLGFRQTSFRHVTWTLRGGNIDIFRIPRFTDMLWSPRPFSTRYVGCPRDFPSEFLLSD